MEYFSLFSVPESNIKFIRFGGVGRANFSNGFSTPHPPTKFSKNCLLSVFTLTIWRFIIYKSTSAVVLFFSICISFIVPKYKSVYSWYWSFFLERLSWYLTSRSHLRLKNQFLLIKLVNYYSKCFGSVIIAKYWYVLDRL